MTNIEIVIIVLLAIAVAMVLYKLHLRRRLNDIDGFYGIHTEDLNQNENVVIGTVGKN